jgi:hypothetical protein
MEMIRGILVAVGLCSDTQEIVDPDEWLTETARELKRSQKSVQHHRQFKCCVNILPKNMDKHLQSKTHLKFASDFGPGSGGNRERAGRKSRSFDR